MRHLVVITPPKPVLSLDEAKKHMRVDDQDSDEDIAIYLGAADQWLGGPRGWLGRALNPFQCRFTVETCPWLGAFEEYPTLYRNWHPFSRITLPFPPLISVDSVQYPNASGDLVTMDPGAYVVRGVGAEDRATIEPANHQLWPTHEVVITTTCGYVLGEGDQSTVPLNIRQALRLLTAQWYRNREPAAPGQTAELPFAVNVLVSPSRVIT